MTKLASLAEQKFYTAMRWGLQHQLQVVVVLLLAVTIPMGLLNLLAYQAMQRYEDDNTRLTKNQLKYIASRLVLETHQDLSSSGALIFHIIDREHTELLHGKPDAPKRIINNIQQTINKDVTRINSQQDPSRRLPAPITFLLLPKAEKSWSVLLPDSIPDPNFVAVANRARDYFAKLNPADKDVLYLFYYDQPSQLLLLLHAINGEPILNEDKIPAPRPINAVMGISFSKAQFTKKHLNSLTSRSQINRFDTTPVDALMRQSGYHFRIQDEKGQVLFTDTPDWDKLAQDRNYITAHVSLTASQNFLTGWRYSVMLKSNLRQTIDISLAQMFWATEGVALIMIILMIVVLKAGLVAVKVSDMKSDIVAGVSHDLKTPLAGIIASAQLLATGRVSAGEETKQFSGYILTEAKRLSEVVDKVLTLAKLESHQIKMQPGPLTVPELVDQAIHSIRCAFPDAIILKGGLPQDEFYGDFQGLTTVLVNLMENAIRYSQNQAWVKVQAFWSEYGEQRTLHLSVEDRGVGISAAEQPFIFQKFYRVRNGLVTNTDGTGLGLAIASQIVRAHNGYIHVESEVGVGSKFIVRLPDERPHFNR